MNICFITDSNYLVPTMTAIKSLIFNSRKEKISVYVVCYKVSEDECKQIQKLQTKNIEINIVDASDKVVNIGLEHFYVSRSALLKFYLPIIFPNEDKMLYLDGDILVNSSLKDFYETNITDKYAAVISDVCAVIQGHEKTLNLENYFNSGVMLLNLKKMREDNITDKLIEYKKNDKNNYFMDQNALNAVFDSNVVFSDLKYNYMKSNISEYEDSLIIERLGITAEEFYNIKKKFVILHMTNVQKPWKEVNAPCFKEFVFYLLELPNCQIKKDTIKLLFRDNYLMLFKYYLRQNRVMSKIIDFYEQKKTLLIEYQNKIEKFLKKTEKIIKKIIICIQCSID